MVLLFFGALGYWQVFRTDLADRIDNPRALASFSDPGRGRILDRDGNVLVWSNAAGERVYAAGNFAHVVGYLSARFGSAGAEAVFNSWLAGESGDTWSAAWDAEFQRAGTAGFDVRLTIDSELQQVAAEGLGDQRGAVVALDPLTGEVLAMVSVPSFDPASFSEEGDDIAADERFPLLNRAAQGLYPPGSTFKTVTAIAALEHRLIEPGTEVTCPGEIEVDGFPISCSNVSQGVGTYPFSDAFAFSVNAIFAQVGLEVGWGRLLETAGRLGFGTAVDFTLETAETQMLPMGTESTDVLLATTAFGQGELLATPLQMALVAAAVGNDGVLMRPHLGLDAYDGERRVGAVEGQSSRRVMPEGVARDVQAMMVEVITNGQANGVAISGVDVAGKTGTAETGSGTSHAWFIGFAPADNPVVAVAVVVENGGQGGVVASPIAGAVIRAALAD